MPKKPETFGKNSVFSTKIYSTDTEVLLVFNFQKFLTGTFASHHISLMVLFKTLITEVVTVFWILV